VKPEQGKRGNSNYKKKKTQQLIVIEGDSVNLGKGIDEEGETSSEESCEREERHPRVAVRNKRKGRKLDDSEK
jgi:hypothetical protein